MGEARRKQAAQDAMIARHEAAHFVVFHHYATQRRLAVPDRVALIAHETTLGFVAFPDDSFRPDGSAACFRGPPRHGWTAVVVGLLAGQVATLRWSGEVQGIVAEASHTAIADASSAVHADAAATDDFRRALSIADGLFPRRPASGGRFFKRAWRLANAIVAARWTEIDRLAAALLVHRELDGRTAAAIALDGEPEAPARAPVAARAA